MFPSLSDERSLGVKMKKGRTVIQFILFLLYALRGSNPGPID